MRHGEKMIGVEKKDLKVLLRNFFSLTVLQGLNIILPFLLMSFLIQTVGIENFGLLTFAHTVILTLQVITEYGFNTIATRGVSVHSESIEKVNKIFSEVILTKVMLTVACFIILVGLVFFIPKFKENMLLYFLYFGIIVGQTLFPVWLFQGLQEMKYITYVNVVFKTIFTLCIFIFVKQESDIWMVPFFISLGFICSGITSLIIAYYKFHIRHQLVGIKSVKKQLSNAYYMFLSETQMVAISYFNILFVGFLLGDTVVGLYSSAEKVIRAIANMQAPLINAIFPYMSKLMVEDKTKAIKFVHKLKNIGSIVFVFFIIALFIFAQPFFDLIYGEKTHQDVILIFRILLVFPLFSFLDQVFGRLVLLTSRREKQFFRVFFMAAIISVVLVLIMTIVFGSIGTAIANSVVQLFIMLGMYHYTKPILTLKA